MPRHLFVERVCSPSARGDDEGACNDHNQYWWLPVDDSGCVDARWLGRQPSWVERSFRATFPDAATGCVAVPHERVLGGDSKDHAVQFRAAHPAAAAFYTWWRSLYDFTVFAPFVPGALLLPLSPAALDEMRALCVLGQANPHREPPWEQMLHLNAEVVPAAREFLARARSGGGDGTFVKSGTKSCKNDWPRRLFPALTITDMFEQLVKSGDVAADYLRPQHASAHPRAIVLQRWDATIGRDTEFRVFVTAKRVVAAAQQQWHTRLAAVPDLGGFLEALDALAAALPYADAVLDVHWHGGALRLIEVNPGGRWGSSGASLWSWDELAALLPDEDGAVPCRVWAGGLPTAAHDDPQQPVGVVV